MYNRYIPQADGTWRRSRVEPTIKPQEPLCDVISPEPCSDIPEPVSPPCEPPKPPQHHPNFRKSRPCPKEQPVGAFLRNLLPQGFDTGDLLILLLLLLMAGDSPEDRETALLTLGIYLFT